MTAAACPTPELARSRSPYADAPRLPPGEGLTAAEILGSAAPARLELEIGPGRGGFIIERLAADPATHIVGLEIRLKWASLVDDRVRASGHGGRGRVFAEDVRLALPRFREGSLSHVFIHFPDPWWKKRHEKRKVLNERFVKQIERVLVSGGSLHYWTDVLDRFEATLELLAKETTLVGPLDVPEREPEHDLDYRTHFERRTRLAELPVYRAEFRKP